MIKAVNYERNNKLFRRKNVTLHWPCRIPQRSSWAQVHCFDSAWSRVVNEEDEKYYLPFWWFYLTTGENRLFYPYSKIIKVKAVFCATMTAHTPFIQTKRRKKRMATFMEERKVAWGWKKITDKNRRGRARTRKDERGFRTKYIPEKVFSTITTRLTLLLIGSRRCRVRERSTRISAQECTAHLPWSKREVLAKRIDLILATFRE